MRYELTDHEWAAIKPMLPNKPRGVARVNDRRVRSGIFWVLRSGAPWRDLPDSFGRYTTCYNRFVRWRRAGVWGKIMSTLACGHETNRWARFRRFDLTEHQIGLTARHGVSRGSQRGTLAQ
jgi:transposase